jgi:hypothetical protein
MHLFREQSLSALRLLSQNVADGGLGLGRQVTHFYIASETLANFKIACRFVLAFFFTCCGRVTWDLTTW